MLEGPCLIPDAVAVYLLELFGHGMRCGLSGLADGGTHDQSARLTER